MARAAVKAKQAAQAKAQPAKAAPRHGRRRHAAGGNPNQHLFFNRLRRQAKWMYVLLAVLFAITFAAVGVGSGSSGLEGLFNGISLFGNGNPVGDAKAEIKKNPAKGWRQLASAYETKGDNANAIGALQQYVKLRPHDESAYTELGGLQLSEAQKAVAEYQSAQAVQQQAAPGQAFRPGGDVGKALGSDPIEQATASQANDATQSLYQKALTAYTGAIDTYKQLAKVEPRSASAQFQLAQAAQTAGDAATAAAAYKRYLQLDPTTPQRKQIEKLIKQYGG
jgi:tetratricopeptide (TPR) repeat protein